MWFFASSPTRLFFPLTAALVTPLVLLLLVVLMVHPGRGVDRSKFKTCEQATFCRRHRRLSAAGTEHRAPEWRALADTLRVTATSVVVDVSAANGTEPQLLELEVTGLESGVMRVRLREKAPRHARYEVADSLLPLTPGRLLYKPKKRLATVGKGALELHFDAPFRLDYFNTRGELVLSLNQRHLLQWEFHRAKPSGLTRETDLDGEWDENFQTHEDRKPRGPESVGLDVTFVGVQHVAGIPSHATNVSLPATRGSVDARYSDPYRMYNLDVFEYELDNPMALYAHVPLMLGHGERHTTGFFWLNAAETWIDVDKSAVPGSVSAHWISESGIIDVFLLPGPTPKDVMQQYAQLTGPTALPPRFAIAYHQCKWNYKSEAEVTELNGLFEHHGVPYDVVWLDIEHTNGKRYMTWDGVHFPSPKRMVDEIAAYGRRMVTIVDPHLKRDEGYRVHKSAQAGSHYIRDRDGNEFDGWCWPGSSSWPDFLQQSVRDWWAALFAYDVYEGSTPSLFTWNDMNEPSVFNGPETTMHKDAKHLSGHEHRDVHNAYGMAFHAATAQGQLARNADRNARPFVLSRAGFAGTQRFGAIWTGDNTADWSHLRASQPMVVALGLGGIAFAGADVGGFFGNPDGELLARWYQAAAYQPFFRGHAHLDSKRREPWVFDEPYRGVMVEAIRERYRLLPYVYTLFHEASRTGVPVLRALWMEFPADNATFAVDDATMLGDALLVAPVYRAGAVEHSLYLPPAGAPWYSFDRPLAPQRFASGHVTVATPLTYTPVFVRGGSVVVRQERLRRSSQAMNADPFTVVVALDASGSASGQLYWDDGVSFDYQRSPEASSVLRVLSMRDGVLRNSAAAPSSWAGFGNSVERIVVAGLDAQPAHVRVVGGGELDWRWNNSVLTIRNPQLAMARDWAIEFKH